MARIIREFLKNWCSLGINTCIQYVEPKVNQKSGFVDIRVLIWRKKIKDGRHDPNIFPNSLKNWCSLEINTCIQYVEHQMNWKRGFVEIRVTWYGWEARRGRNHTKTKSLPLVGRRALKNTFSSFKQAVRRHLIDKLVNRYNSDFLYY